MKFSFLKRKKFWKRLIILTVIAPVLLFAVVVGVVYWKQDAIVQEVISTFNEDFRGEIEILDSHVSPFENFPYISVDLDHVKIYETKEDHAEPVLAIDDVYVGFDLWTLLSGDYDIKAIELKKGFIHVIQHKDGEINILKALSPVKEIEDPAEEFHIHLKSIELIDIDIYKLNEANNLMVESFIEHAEMNMKTDETHILAGLEAEMELNVIVDGDTTFFKHKELIINSDMEYRKADEQLIIHPSDLELEHAMFKGDGVIDIADDFNLNLNVQGAKENFDMFTAFAPEEMQPVFDRYDNAGEIAFLLRIVGKSNTEEIPMVYATFSCKDAHFTNNRSNKKLDNLNFSGVFTNNGLPGVENLEFTLSDFSARPEAGNFKANLHVIDFGSPNIEMTLDSDFDLGFLATFLDLDGLSDMHGKVGMHMKFHDIIDLERPERSIEKLNEAYYAELTIEDLGFESESLGVPLDKLNTHVVMDGHAAEVEYLTIKMGRSDLAVSGHISDLPAILHHSDQEVVADLAVSSKRIDIKELTTTKDTSNKPVDEQIDNFEMDLKFVSSARNFTESPNLPRGEFFIENLFADLQHYPHTFHDFHADLFVEDSNFRIMDFSGFIDETDFHFDGKLYEYVRWMEAHPKGDTRIDFDLTSDQFQLEDIFSYQGENYVPEDYRHEILNGLKLHGSVELHYNDGFRSADLRLTEVGAKMKMHPFKVEKINGRFHYEDDHIVMEEMAGKIGRSVFEVDMNYYLGEDEAIKKRDNHFGIRASRLDFDQLFSYDADPHDLAKNPDEHEEVFNIYTLPFSTMTIDLDIDNLNYHRYLLSDVHGRLRTTPDHYVYVDTFRLNAAGGRMMLSGYFNGSNKDEIYFSPNMVVKGMDLDKLLFKFENFGQDHLVSENLHGTLTAKITGKIHMHPDLIPIIDDSEIHMDVEVLNGRLVNYAPIVDLKEYFVDKNVYDVRFDTLKNHMDIKDGEMVIPSMTINSTLGLMVISGSQDMNYNMDYYIRVPLKLIAGTGFKKLFGKNKEEVDPDQVDEIDYEAKDKSMPFLNLHIVGDEEDYKVSIGKDKGK